MNIRCPFCGGRLKIFLVEEPMGSMHSMIPGGLRCVLPRCGAEWDEHGDVTKRAEFS